MTIISLDPTKVPIEIRPGKFNANELMRDVSFLTKLDEKRFIGAGIQPAPVYHVNYLNYLEFCWAHHYVAVLTPDILWFGLLTEIASLIRVDPEVVRSLFTSSPDKVEITVQTSDPTHLPLQEIAAQLSALVPSGADNYLPTFSTTTSAARFAHYAAFADAVSPYYSYATYLCGLPAIRVEGTVDDYVKLAESWRKLPDLLKQQAPAFVTQVQDVLEKTVVALEGARSDRPLATEKAREWFRGMFVCEKCGSGSQTEIEGWITQLQRVQPDGPRFASNFASQIAKVDYKNLETQREFSLLYGLFSSQLDMGVAIPQFGPLVFERTKS